MEDESGANWKLLFISSISIDLIQIVIGLTGIGIAFNEIINIIYAFIYGYYLKRKGINILTAKKILRVASIFGIDEITLGFFPTWTLDTYLTFKSNKKSNNSKPPPPLRGVGNMRSANEPLNKNGIRLPRNIDDSVIK